jgi:hypothetical protein
MLDLNYFQFNLCINQIKSKYKLTPYFKLSHFDILFLSLNILIEKMYFHLVFAIMVVFSHDFSV